VKISAQTKITASTPQMESAICFLRNRLRHAAGPTMLALADANCRL